MKTILLAIPILAALVAANSVEDCGLTPSAHFHGSVAPDPVLIPGSLTMAFEGDTAADWPADVMLRVEVIKELDTPPYNVEIPCISGLGSCEVDMCAYITKYPDVFCPLFPAGVECSCTIKAGHYTADGFTIPLPDLGPAIDLVLSGGYHGNVTLYSKSAPTDLLGCIKFDFTLKYEQPPTLDN